MTVDDLLQTLRDSRSRTSVQLQNEFGASQATVSRLVVKAGDRILRLGAGRSTRYTLAVDLFGVQPNANLFKVGETGILQEIGSLRQLATGGFIVTGDDLPFWALGAGGDGAFGGLPYFLADLRPAGFLGRLTARHLAPSLAAPDDPRDWTTEQIGRYLLHSGTDLPGNLVLGDRAAEVTNRAVLSTVRDRASRYPELVQRNLDEGQPGSSAAGEQPKFLAYVEGPEHVIVKYSEPAHTTAGRRWADLLAAECHALRVVAAHGQPAAHADICQFDDRTYLESRRFDRVGKRGRRPAFSLGAVDAEFAGEGPGWSRIAASLLDSSLLRPESYDQIVWLETFGHWIGNSDMHAGNLSLRPLEDLFELLPVYDMLPTRLSRIGESLESIELAPPIRTKRNDAVWEASGVAASAYWEELGDDTALSDEFRAFAVRHARQWRTLLPGARTGAIHPRHPSGEA